MSSDEEKQKETQMEEFLTGEETPLMQAPSQQVSLTFGFGMT